MAVETPPQDIPDAYCRTLFQAVSTPGGRKLKLAPQIAMLVQGQCNLVDALNIDLRIILK